MATGWMEDLDDQRRGTELRGLNSEPIVYCVDPLRLVGLLPGRGGRFNQVSAGSLSRIQHMDC